jgi:hypothetical protein
MSPKFITSAVVLALAIVCSTAPFISVAEAGSKKIYQGGSIAGGKLGPKAVALTSSDCRKVDGTVIEVADDRCGSSRQYCKLSNGNAVCIDKRD